MPKSQSELDHLHYKDVYGIGFPHWLSQLPRSTNTGALDLGKERRLEHPKFEDPNYVSTIGFLLGAVFFFFLVHGLNLIFPSLLILFRVL